jgi:hypothetical protein
MAEFVPDSVSEFLLVTLTHTNTHEHTHIRVTTRSTLPAGSEQLKFIRAIKPFRWFKVVRSMFLFLCLSCALALEVCLCDMILRRPHSFQLWAE